MSSSRDRGRDDLKRWKELQSSNFFQTNLHLQRILKRIWGSSYDSQKTHLEAFGEVAANQLDAAAVENNEHVNLPRLNRWSSIGERTESIAHHPSYHDCGKAIYEDGKIIQVYEKPASNVMAQALFYLSSHAGEAGHNCPVACTAGVVKALQKAGSNELQEKWLSGLLAASYKERLDGAQFLTEVQGGSDVGANCVEATPDGTAYGTTRWRIRGEKWFCSNADADLILMTARQKGGPAGTAGLGLFLVPRLLECGAVNGFHLRRLKDKIGTRSMASAEIDFEDAVGYAVGPVESGFATVMECVINTSRLYNSVGCTGLARRAYDIASSYARARQAFGQTIISFPLVQDMLASMLCTEQVMLSGVMRLAEMQDQKEERTLSKEMDAFLRVATNITKMRTCQHSHQIIMRGIETLGGNGAIESFSVLPRLLRDNVVYENWEGTHNTLIAQTLRDFARHSLHKPFIAILEQLWRKVEAQSDNTVWGGSLERLARILEQSSTHISSLLAKIEETDVTIQLRQLLEILADAYFAIAYLSDVTHLSEDADEVSVNVGVAGLFLEKHLEAFPNLKKTRYVERLGTILIQ